MHSLQKMSFSVLLCGVLVVSSILFAPTDSLGALPKKKLEIIIGGENFCKDDKDCAGDSFCNMTSHICIICPKPFEWVGGTQCVCPSGTVPNADNTDCVECLDDTNCTTLKKSSEWYCDTGTNICINCPSPKEWHADTNTCECPSYTIVSGDSCICDNPNKTLVDGLCQCQLDEKTSCLTSDFMGEINCACCPDDKPVWNKASGELAQCVSCAEIDATKPYYNPDTKTCEECLTDAHCENEKVCSADKTCVCEMTGTECTSSDFNATQCMCCPAEAPVYDEVSGTCKTCAEMHPEWAESGTAYDITTKQCWPYCKEQNVGLVMLVDRSGSTDDQCKTTRILTDGTKQTLYCEDLITEALQSLEIPEKMKTAMYLHNTSLANALNNPLPYGNNDKVAIHNAITNYTLTDGTVTTFKQALNDITNNICPTGDKLIVIMWTDGVLGSTETPLKNMKAACANAKFYYIGPSDKYDNDGYYAIKSLPETYANHLNDYMKQEGCVPKPEDKTAE